MPYPDARFSTSTNFLSVSDPYGSWNFNTQYSFWHGRTSWFGTQRGRKPRFLNCTVCSSSGLEEPPRSSLELSSNNGTGYWSKTSLNGEAIWVAGYQGGPYVETYTDTKGVDEANLDATKNRAYARIFANDGLGETLGEGKGTYDWAVNRTKHFVKIFTLAGRGNFSAAAAAILSATGYNASKRSIKRLERKFGSNQVKAYDVRRASAAYLEWSFGIAPLIQSIHDSLKTLSSNNGYYRSSSATTYGEHGSKSRVGFTGIYATAYGRDLDQLGLLNPALVAWQLVPFSFVVDWFLPISTIIGSLSTMFMHTFYGWTATLSYSFYTRTFTDSGMSGSSAKSWSYARAPYLPTSVLDIFSLRHPGPQQLVTAAALVSTLRK